jgi:hypothetical protein
VAFFVWKGGVGLFRGLGVKLGVCDGLHVPGHEDGGVGPDGVAWSRARGSHEDRRVRAVGELGELGEEREVSLQKLDGVVWVLAERRFGAGMPRQKVAVDTVKLGTVDGKTRVVVVEGIALAGCPAVCFLDDLNLFCASAPFRKVVDLKRQPKVSGHRNECGILGEYGVAPDEVLPGPHTWLDVRCDLDGPVQRVLGY